MAGTSSGQVEELHTLTPELVRYLRRDPVRNAFVAHDLAEEPGRTRFWLARRGGEPVAHLLVYDSSEFGATWAHIAGDPNVAVALVPYIPDRKVVVLAQPDFADAVTDRMRDAKVIPEDIMEVDRGHAWLGDTAPAVRIGPEHAEAYARMVVPSVVPWSTAIIERNRDHLRREVVYGVFQDKTLVAVAGTSVRTPDAWIVGGVETLPNFRRRGFARAAVSAVTQEALRAVERVGLWVSTENRSAKALYEGLGYRKCSESAWIDNGTGLEP